MSKVYKCDCCEEIIKDPHEARMKEFYVGADYDIVCGILPLNSKNTTKIHLCDNCYKGLKAIGERVIYNDSVFCSQPNCPNCKDGKCEFPLHGTCLISDFRKGRKIIGGEND